MMDRKSWHMCLPHKLYKSQNLALSPQLLPGQLLTTSWTLLPFGRWQDANHIETNPPAPMPRQAALFGGGIYWRMVCWGSGVCGSMPLKFWPWTTLRSKRPLVFILFWSVGGSHSVLNAWEGCRGLKEKSCGATSLKLASYTARAAPNLSIVLNLSHLTMTETKHFPKKRLYA